MLLSFFVFLFEQKTAYEMRISDWSSDVCSSDLFFAPAADETMAADPDAGCWPRYGAAPRAEDVAQAVDMLAQAQRPLILAGGGALSSREAAERSEQRRGGKECASARRYRCVSDD